MSEIKQKTNAVRDSHQINHNFGQGYTLKIIEIAPDKKETVLLEIESSAGRFVNLQADITDNEI